MPDEVLWEYCFLTIHKESYYAWHDDKKGNSGFFAEIFIEFISNDQAFAYDLCKANTKDKAGKEIHEYWEFYPPHRVIGLLGNGGWELIQVDNHYSDVDYYYFKRPIIAGRAVSEPKIELLPEPKRV